MFLARLGEITCRKLGIIACFTSMKQGLLILVMLLDTGKTYPSDFISAMSCPLKDFVGNLVEHRTGIAEVTGSNPVEALIFFRLLLPIA